MIYTTLAVLAMSASAAITPLRAHMHSHVKPVDHRISVTVYNNASNFRELTVNGKTYTVLPYEELAIKAPVGTQVLAGSIMPFHKVGDLVLEVTPKLDHQKININ